jgi:DNA-binding transcriptional ArsR family regulator
MELTSVTPSPHAMRALAHPVRLRMLGLLRSDGPSTATLLAARLGLNSGATSYHLRQLAEHGFVSEDHERGNARERWWRAAHQSTATSEEQERTPEGREAADAFRQAVAVIQTETLQRAVEERSLLPEEWRRASMLSDWHLRVTPEGAERLRQALADLVSGWDEEPDAEDAAEFVVVVDTFPRPGTVTGGEPA